MPSVIDTSPAPARPFAGIPALRKAWLEIDKNPAAIAFVATPAGKIAALAGFLAILGISFRVSLSLYILIAATVCLIAALPQRRAAIVCGASIFYVMMQPFRIEAWYGLSRQLSAAILPGMEPRYLIAIVVGSFLAIAFGVLSAMKNAPGSLIARRPVMTLILGWFALFAAAMSSSPGTSLHAYLWILTGVSISSLWYFAYAAAGLRSKDTSPVAVRASFMRPFWSGSATPIGKSFGYLNKFDAADDEALAVTRLKALKLAVWALILTGVVQIVDYGLYQSGQLVSLQTAILAHARDESVGILGNWAAVVVNYFDDLLIIAVWGHFIVATIRMCGWRIPRNTANPLASRTLAEFWNRYFFYFKELLVDFFFYPAFLRFFKKNTKLRIAFATFCAAGLGNFLYHFTRETHLFAVMPARETIAVFESAIFYSLVLAAGLIISQWRGRKVKPVDGFFRYHVWPRINVMAFFCFLKIFDDISGEGSLSERAAFTLGLFGV